MHRTHTSEIQIGNVSLKLTEPYEASSKWVGNPVPEMQLRAAWLKFGENDLPMSPRLVGKPGVGKTTLAVTVAQSLGQPVYLMQATADTRPEDLIVLPIVTGEKEIAYQASPLVTAMIKGGVCVLDEGNRMSEKSWASLAPLLDHRRYVDSVLAGVRIQAHADFRFVTTMNDDASVFDLPEYIQSRLAPQIVLDFPDTDTESKILKAAVPYTDSQVLSWLLMMLQEAHAKQQTVSVRDAIQIAKYAMRILSQSPGMTIEQCMVDSVVMVLGEEAIGLMGPYRTDPGGGSRHLKPV